MCIRDSQMLYLLLLVLQSYSCLQKYHTHFYHLQINLSINDAQIYTNHLSLQKLQVEIREDKPTFTTGTFRYVSRWRYEFTSALSWASSLFETLLGIPMTLFTITKICTFRVFLAETTAGHVIRNVMDSLIIPIAPVLIIYPCTFFI